MTHPANEGFTDNWAYLKTELTWLDRMLMMALARYRQEKKSVDRIAQSPADQASSHWWKGVVSLDGNIAYDEHRPSVPVNGHKSAKSGESSIGGQSGQPQPQAKLGYQQQLDLRIQASNRNGVTLALPWLCDRLNLSLFEKNLILMALAPEVNRRFARLYRYLQSYDDHLVSDLPSVELVLRLLCRNDQEWRRARQQLNPDAALMTHNLVLLLYQSHDPFLNATIRLADEVVDCLLAEDPDPNDLEALLTVDDPPGGTSHQWPDPHLLPVHFSNQLSEDTANSTQFLNPDRTDNITRQTDTLPTDEETDSLDDHGISPEPEADGIVDVTHDPENGSEDGEGSPTTQVIEGRDDGTEASPIDHDSTHGQWAPTWSDLVLPAPLLQSLRHLTQRFHWHNTVNQFWPEQSPKFAAQAPGLVLLFAGPRGTGKTLAANVLAHDIADSLTCVNLAEIMQVDYPMVMDEVEATCPPVVLIQAAEQWLRCSASIPSARLAQFFAQRRQHHGLTILSVERVESVAQGWRQQIHPIFHFPLPDATVRQVLWKRAFPPKLKLGRTIDWDALSQIDLSGGAIGAIAHDAMVRMVADHAKTLKLQYLVEALQWHQVPNRPIKLLQNAARPSRSRSTARRFTTKTTTAATPTSNAKSKSKDNPNTAKTDGAALSATIFPPANSATTLESSQLPGGSGEVPPSSEAQAAPASAQPPTQVKRGQMQPTDVVTADHHADANV